MLAWWGRRIIALSPKRNVVDCHYLGGEAIGTYSEEAGNAKHPTMQQSIILPKMSIVSQLRTWPRVLRDPFKLYNSCLTALSKRLFSANFYIELHMCTTALNSYEIH